MFIKNPDDGSMIGPGNPRWNSAMDKILKKKNAKRMASIKKIVDVRSARSKYNSNGRAKE
jgi:hypothetical protein